MRQSAVSPLAAVGRILFERPLPVSRKTIQDSLTREEKQAVDTLYSWIQSRWPNTILRLFGSKARGDSDEESDVDILILLPCEVTDSIRRKIIYQVYDINLSMETTISPLIMSHREWYSLPISLLPIHGFIEDEAVAV